MFPIRGDIRGKLTTRSAVAQIEPIFANAVLPLSTKTHPMQNSANIFGLLKTTTLTTLFHGASFHLAHLTTALVKDVISVLKKNSISSFDPTFHP